MTKPKGTPSVNRGENEKTLQDNLPPTKEVGGVKRTPFVPPDNKDTFSSR